MKNRLSSHSGQAIVEMALGAMLFIFAFFGAIEFARALYNYNTIVHYARAAARFAVVNDMTDPAIVDSAKNIAVYGAAVAPAGSPPVLAGLTKDMVSVTLETTEADASGNPINQKVSVIVTGYQFDFAVPILPPITIPPFETSLHTESLGVIPP